MVISKQDPCLDLMITTQKLIDAERKPGIQMWIGVPRVCDASDFSKRGSLISTQPTLHCHTYILNWYLTYLSMIHIWIHIWYGDHQSSTQSFWIHIWHSWWYVGNMSQMISTLYRCFFLPSFAPQRQRQPSYGRQDSPSNFTPVLWPQATITRHRAINAEFKLIRHLRPRGFQATKKGHETHETYNFRG